MKIIKEVNMKHEIFRKVEVSDNTVAIYRLEEPSGYIYVNKDNDRFCVFIYSVEELELNDEIKEILFPYVSEKSYISVDKVNKELIKYLKSLGHRDWYGYISLHLDGDIKEMSRGKVVRYKGEVDTYIDILGRCFEPMRALHDFKPYNWHKSKPEEAKKEFEEAETLGYFYGYLVDGEIVGAGIVDVDDKTAIDILAVKPELQRQGHGRELLRGIVTEMKKELDIVKIGVIESNQHVLRLYMSEGFVIDRHEKRYKNY